MAAGFGFGSARSYRSRLLKQIAFLGRYMHCDVHSVLRLPKTVREGLMMATSEIMSEESAQAKLANDID